MRNRVPAGGCRLRKNGLAVLLLPKKTLTKEGDDSIVSLS